MIDTVTVRRAVPSDVPAILGVLASALGETPLLQRTPELWHWKHVDNPFGSSIVLVAERGGRMAGVRAFMRWELSTPSGETIRCVRAVDTATHPDFHRQGVFRTLTMTALEAAREDGAQLVFNTPNPKSAPGYLKMGWSEVGWVGAMVRPRLFGALRWNSPSPPPLDSALPGLSPYQRGRQLRDRPPLGLRTERSTAYGDWRYAGHPRARYAWVEGEGGSGAVARSSIRGGRTETVLADLLGGAGREEISRLARSSRSRYIGAWFSPGTPERAAAISAGVLPVPRLRTLRLVSLPLADLPLDAADPASWDLSIGDLELL